MDKNVNAFLELIGLDSTSFSYNEMVERYKAFLVLFLDQEKDYYLDINLLSTIALGFERTYQFLFLKSEVDMLTLEEFVLTKYNDLLEKTPDKVSESEADTIYAITSVCVKKLGANELEYACVDTIISMFKNAYYIDQGYQPKVKEIGN